MARGEWLGNQPIEKADYIGNRDLAREGHYVIKAAVNPPVTPQPAIPEQRDAPASESIEQPQS